MTRSKCPLSVTILAWLYIAVGTGGFFAHFRESFQGNALQYDGIGIEVVEVLAVVTGVFMLRGRNWARWLAIAWMAFHVVISVFETYRQLAVHSVFFVVIAWLLLRPDARRYFGGESSGLQRNA